MSHKKYWKGFDELERTPEFEKKAHNEFAEKLPLLSELSESELKTPRRDFLKMLGFSLGAATVAAGCEMPIRKAIPYVVKPEEILPGMPTYYASTFVNGSDVCSVLVKTREGRPIFVSGNELSEVTKGGINARAQASVVSLYDSARLKSPQIDAQPVSWERMDSELKKALDGASGDIVFLTDPVVSPTVQSLIDKIIEKNSNFKVVVYEAISRDGMLKANEAGFGKRFIPTYDFEKAETIVAINCDFLSNWLSPIAHTKQYVANRKVDPAHPSMSRHFQFESHLTRTGAKADYRSSILPSEEGKVITALYNEVAKLTGGVALTTNADLSPSLQEKVKKAAVGLSLSKAKSLVVSGSNDTNVQLLVNGINQMLGAYGTTIDVQKAMLTYQAEDAAMDALIGDMESGRVGALLVNGVNPSYSHPQSDRFNAALKKVRTTVSFNDRVDETTENCKFKSPASHYLESWGDAEAISGQLSLIQPTISPLFNTRSLIASLMILAEVEGEDYDYIKKNWEEKYFSKQSAISSFDDFWVNAVHDGVFTAKQTEQVDELPSLGATFSGDVQSAARTLNAKKSGGVEVVLYEKEGMGDGRYANNPFLQEMPDPISKVCWDNYAVVSHALAKNNGWSEGDIISIKSGNYSIELPVVLQPGIKENVVAVALGYGRTRPGNDYCGVGKNAFPFVGFDGTFSYHLSGVSLDKVGSGFPLAQTQTHHTIDDRREIINKATLSEYKISGYAGNESGRKKADKYYADKHYFSLYPDRSKEYSEGHHWGMNIDLNACTGCGACVVACNIENNVPIVGKEEVHRAHEMHWLRIDRYYAAEEGDEHFENPSVAFQPMLCQHCDNAPCENVCPVNATNHSAEGINQMAYNRCIGTRYCANNCPFKVRRFNWFDYQGADSFYANTIFTNDEYVMADDLSRMVLNPDVTVRARGVMEKCSFCVQRIQAGKLEAKKAGKQLEDGMIVTACQAACSAGAIVFGDMNDESSEVHKANANERTYHLLQDLQVLPSVAYQTMIVNRDEPLNGKIQKKPKVEHHS